MKNWILGFALALASGVGAQTPSYLACTGLGSSRVCSTPGSLSPDALLSKIINKTMANADAYSGSDIGAKINAADAALGANPGTITVNTTGNVTTQVALSAKHNLQINVPLTWRVQDAWFNAYNEASGIIPAGSNTITGVLKGATQTITTADVTGAISPIRGTALVYGTNVSNVVEQNLQIAWSEQYGGGGFGTDTGNRAFMCATCSNVKALNNDVTNGGNIKTTSTAALVFRSDPDAAYNNVTTGNSSYNVTSIGNHCSGWGPDVGSVIGVYCNMFAFTYGVVSSDNIAENVSLNETIWGGASVNDWARALALGDPWSDTYHKAGFATFTGGTSTNVQVGQFASMAHDVTFTGHVANGCNDICFDSEGSHNIRFVNINGTDGVHGELYTLIHNENVTFDGGTANHSLLDVSHDEKMFQNLAGTDPTQERNVIIQGVHFNCLRTDYFCDVHLYPMSNFTFYHNVLKNVTFSTAGAPYTSQGKIMLDDSEWTYDHTPLDGLPWSAIYPSTSGIYPIYVTNNKVITTVAQPSSSNAITVLNAYSVGKPGDVIIRGNKTSQTISGLSYAWPNDVHVGVTSMTGGAASQAVNFIVQSNDLGNNTVFAANTGCATGCDNVTFSIANGISGKGKYLMSGYPAFDNGSSVTLAKLSNPTGTPSGTPATTGGTIANGTSNYAQIVAVTDAGGQTLPGTISGAVTTTGSGTSSITWTWTAVTGAYAYQVFVCDTAACTPSHYFSAASTSFIQTLPASSGTGGTLPAANAAGGKVAADSANLTSLTASLPVFTDASKNLVSGTNTYGCIDGYDHLPCAITGLAQDIWTAQTASLTITTVKTGLPAGRYKFSCAVNWTTIATGTSPTSTLPGCFGSWKDNVSGSTVGGNTSATNTANSLSSGASASTLMDVQASGTISVTTSGYASNGTTTQAAYKLVVTIERVK